MEISSEKVEMGMMRLEGGRSSFPVVGIGARRRGFVSDGMISSSDRRSRSSDRQLGQNVQIRFASISLTSLAERPQSLTEEGAPTRLHLPWKDLNLSFRNVRLINWEVRLPNFSDASPEEAVTALNHVYAGTAARTLSQVVCHPVDTVKTRMQIKDPPKKLRKWRKKIVKKAIGIGPIDINNWFFKGPGDLFRGVWGAILGTIPNAALYFVAYEATKRKLETTKLPPGLVHVASASAGTVVASIFRVPADTVKHRVQAYMHPNVFDAVKVILANEGLAGLYRGFWPTLMRDVPEIAIQFSVYEKARSIVQQRRGVEKLSTPEHLLLGALAGAVAATCTMPLDLVKTRQQCGASALAIHGIIMQVYAESGYGGLLAGLGPRVFHVSLMSAAFFGLFEYCKLIMKPDRAPDDRLILPKIWQKRRDHIWKRQFVYTE